MSMGNTVGSRVWPKTAEDFYILGLWLADGYWWSSSIGLSSIDLRLIGKFESFLRDNFPDCSIKHKIYQPDGRQKRKHIAHQLYINNRAFVRSLLPFKVKSFTIPDKFLPAYLAGRIDGDGSIDKGSRLRVRIAYGNQADAERDGVFFGKANVSLYHYESAGTWVLYLRKNFWNKVLPQVQKYSVKLLPRRD